MQLSWPVKLSPPAARSAAEAVSKVQKMGVDLHGLAHPVEVLASYLGKSAIAVLVGDSFTPPEVVLRRKRGAKLSAPLWLKSFEGSTPQ